MLALFEPGSPVEIGPEDAPLRAIVTQVSIHPNDTVQYQVCWWVGVERKEIWLEYFEVRPALDSLKMEIGFLGRNSDA